MACRQLKAELTAVRDYILETMPHFFTRCAAHRLAGRHVVAGMLWDKPQHTDVRASATEGASEQKDHERIEESRYFLLLVQ